MAVSSVSPFETSPKSILALGIVCQIVSAVALWGWATSEWMTFGGPFPKGWEGYTFVDFLALITFVVFAPLGFCITFTALQYYTRKASSSQNSSNRIVLALVSIAVYIALGVFGFYWGWDTLRCGVVGCVNTDSHTWPSTNRAKPEAAIGFKTTIGIPLLITSLSLIAVTIFSLVEYLRNAQYHVSHATVYDKKETHASYSEPLLLSNTLDQKPIPENPLLKRYTPHNTHMLSQSSGDRIAMPDSSDLTKMGQSNTKHWIWFGLFAVFLFWWWFFSGYIPNNWEQYYPARIAQTAGVHVSTEGNLCSTQWQKYTCPEIPNSIFRTIGWKLTDHWELKIYPSNLIFYLFIFTWTLAAVASKSISASIAQFFSTKVRVPVPFVSSQHKRDRLAFFTYAELASLVGCCVFAYLFFHYWFFDHNYVNRWPGPNGVYNITWAERFGRTFGQVAVFFFALLMFPAARNSPLLAMVGVSWEASIQYHRWLGAAFFVFVMAHMFATYWWYLVAGDLKDIYQIPQTLPTSIDNFTVPTISWLVWFSIISIGVLSIALPQFRRKNFDTWMFLHHFTYLTLIPAILWHAQASWEYILPATTIWFFDRMVRAFRSVRAVNLVTAAQASASTGEKYRRVNPFDPNSIDIRIQTPPPITSIHHHKSHNQQRVWFQPITTESEGPANPVPMSSAFVHSSSTLANVSLNAPDVSPVSSPSQEPKGVSSILNVSGPGVRIVDRGEAGTYIELRVVNDNMCYFPGHYAFINIAEISVFEWHPFTIASPAHFAARSEIVFVIKTMGVGTWTQSLYRYIEDYQRSVGAGPNDFVDVPLTVSLDGPYGTPIDFTTYDVVILVGGGIGVTPCKSVYESLLLSYLHDFKARLMYQHTLDLLSSNGTPSSGSALSEPNSNPLLKNLNVQSVPLVATNKRVHLMWSARDPMLFDIMSESLSQVPYGPFSATLFCDNPNMTPQQDMHLVESEKRLLDPNILSLIRIGRPDLETEFKAIVNGLNPNSYLSSETNDPAGSKFSPVNRPTGPVDPTSTQHGGCSPDKTKRVLVFVCGPGPMAQDAEIICQEHGWDFHTETFAL